MSNRQLLPEGLGEMPPGPELGAVLAGVDRSRLSGFDCLELLRSRYRQLNHVRAQLMRDMAEVGLCDIGPDDELPRRAVPDEFGDAEIRAALVLTRRAAEGQYATACGLVQRLPVVLAAVDAGWCDEPRARVLYDWTLDLTVEQARVVTERLLPLVTELTTGQLIEQIKKLAVAIDPEWARRRYETALEQRKVVGSRNPDGTANLSGVNLPLDAATAAAARIQALAKSAKQRGHPGPVDALRADLYLGMLDGSYSNLDDQAILDRLLADQAAGRDSDDRGNGPAHGDESGADRAADTQAGDAAGGGPHDPEAGSSDGGQQAATRAGRGGRELRVRLSTLLGLDQYPGELAGWGFIHAELARDLAGTGLLAAQWRYVITDADGNVAGTGLTRVRPYPAAGPRTRDIVELQVPAALLDQLAACGPAQLGAWSPLVADLARRYGIGKGDGAAERDPRRRLPGAALRRYLQIRDRYCLGLGCRAPARSGEVDHTRDYARGGSTLEHNLEHLCKYEHRLKHEAGWVLRQAEAGRFEWISRLGRHYRVDPPPIIEPLPDPMPRQDEPLPAPEPADHDEPILPAAPEPPRRPRPPPPEPGDDEPPPF